MLEELKKKINNIYEQEFKSKLNGYSKNEVDSYLDNFAAYLEKLSIKIKELDEDNDNLIKENLRLKSVIVKYEDKIKNIKKDNDISDLLFDNKLKKLEDELIELKNRNS